MILRAIFAALLLASATAYACAAEPSDHPTQTEKAPPPPAAMQSLVVVACQTIDVTGQPSRPGQPPRHGVDAEGVYHEEQSAKGWRDLELRLDKGLEYVCKREVLPLEDAVGMFWPPKLAKPLNPDFGNWGIGGRIGMSIVAGWEEKNKGWGVVAIGLPSMVGIDADGDGKPDIYKDGPLRGQYIVKSWSLPGCPSFLPGTNNRMKCRFDTSLI